MKTSNQVIKTACGFCHVNCGMLIETRNGAVLKIKGDPEHPANKGVLCPKGLAARELISSPDRLKYPLKKTNAGFQRISWDEALDTIADRLMVLKEAYGPESLVWCGGAPVTPEAKYGFVQLAAAYGTPNFTGPAHLCSIPRSLGLRLVHGSRSQPDYEKTRFMIFWGANPTSSRQLGEGGAVYGRYDRIIGRAKARGARQVVVDPMRTKMAATADEWLQIKVGTDMALGLAMLNIIIGEKLYDKAFVKQWTVGFKEIKKHVGPYTPEWAGSITGIPADQIAALARAYAITKPASILDGNGLDQHPNVVQTIRTIGILSAITGNIDVPGGDVTFPAPRLGPYLTKRPKLKRLTADVYPLFPSASFPAVVDAIITGKPYRPVAMLVHHSNPLLINANEKKVRKALESLKFLVVSDIFLTATARMADIVLPDTSNFERVGYSAYASAEGGFVSLRQKVVDPIGEARPAFDTEYELAKRMGLEGHFPWKNSSEWVNHRLKPLGLCIDDIKGKSAVYTTQPLQYQKFMKGGFDTPSGRVELFSQSLLDHGYDPLPVYKNFENTVAGDHEMMALYPLVGTTRRPGIYVHTRYRNLPTLHRIQPDPFIWIHPDDALIRDINDDTTAIVYSSKGQIKMKAKITKDIRPGTVVMDFGWGNPWDGQANVNILTSDDLRDSICGSTPNRLFHCQIKKQE